MLEHDAYRKTLPPGFPRQGEYRRLVTARLTLLTMNQNLTWSLFVFYSPADEDSYARPKVKYRLDDHWSAELGGNLFDGERETFFGQFKDNNNAFLALRYGF